MSKPLKVLIVEDSKDDAELLIRELQKGGFDPVWERVETEEAMGVALGKEKWDLVVADYRLPKFSAPNALEVLKRTGIDLPFIIVSGTVEEDAIVVSLKAGARDFFRKDRFKLLPAAVERELKEAVERRERRLADEALKESERKIRAIFDQSFQFIGIMMLDGTLIEANRTAMQFAGVSESDCLGKPFWDTPWWTHSAEMQNKLREAVIKVARGETVRFEATHPAADGSIHYIDFSLKPARDENGKVVFLVPEGRDITDRKIGEERQLLMNESLILLNKSSGALNALSDILNIIKQHTGIEAVGVRLQENEDFPYFETSGFPDDFVKKEDSLCAHDKHGTILKDEQGRPILECMCGNIIRGRINPKLPFFTKGGTFFTNSTTDLLASTTEEDRMVRTRNWCNTAGYESVALIPLRSGDSILGLLQLNDHRRDRFTPDMIAFFEGFCASIGIAISRKRSEDALRKNEARYRTIIENVYDIVYSCTTDGTITFITPNISVLGYSLEDVVGRQIFEFIHPDDLESMKKDFEMTINSGEVFPSICRLKKKGGEYIYIEEIGKVVMNEGEPVGINGVIRDITDRKRSEIESQHDKEELSEWSRVLESKVLERTEELEKAHQRLVEQGKLALLGQVSASISHELRTPLTGIRNSVYLMQMLGVEKDNPKIAENIALINMEIDACVRVLNNMLDFVRPKAPITKESRLDVVISNTLASIMIPQNIKVSKEISSTLPNMMIDAMEIQQAFDNIIKNAIEAMNMGGELTVTACVDGNYVVVEFSDTGAGIMHENLHKIFDPLFSTSPTGVGLGLTIARQLIEAHGGTIEAQSRTGQGSKFIVRLPVN